MHIHFLDPYHPLPSLIHALDARVKLILVVGFILTTSLMPVGVWAGYLILYALLISAEILSEVSLRYYLSRALFSIPFILAAIPLPFTTSGKVLTQFQLDGLTLIVSVEGVARLLSVALKSWISVQAAILLAVSTTFPDILLAMRAVGVPRLLVAVFGLMWRYLFVFADEALRLMRARAARSSKVDGYPSGRSLAWRANIAGGMAGSLFLRGFERADRVYLAMVARGYDGEIRSLPLPTWKKTNTLVIVLGLIIYFFILLMGSIIHSFR
ncbi:MAG: cobalt ECF transporter T component CbiQ [Anaerolineales bacterium]